MKKNPWNAISGYLNFILLAGIVLGSAYLRLYKIREYMTFLGDEGRDVLIVKRMIVNHDIPFIGPTASVAAFFLGPLYYYMMAPFLWMFKLDPVGPAIMVALFGVATVYLMYKATKEWYGSVAAFCSSVLYAVSPLVIAQSRSSWNPNVVPFFALLYVYSLYKAVTTRRFPWFLLAGICIGAGVQFHYLFLFLVPVALVLLVQYGRGKEYIAKATVFLGGIVLPLLPFIGFEIKNNFPNTRTILRFLTAGKEVGYGAMPWVVWSDVLFRSFARLVFYFPGSEQFYRFEPFTLVLWRIGIILAMILSVSMLVYRMVQYRQVKDILLGWWLFFGTFLFIFYQRAIYDYYLTILFPLPFILLGVVFERWWHKKYFRVFSVGAVILLFVLNWSGRPFLNAPNNQVGHVEKVSRFVFDQTEGRPFNFALITSSNSDHAYRYFFDIWGNPPITIENSENDPERKTVTDQLFVICEMSDCKPLGNSLWQIAGFGRAEIVDEWEEGLKVYKLVHLRG